MGGSSILFIKVLILLLPQELINHVKQNENLDFVQMYILTLKDDENFSFRAAQENAGTYATELFTLATATYLKYLYL